MPIIAREVPVGIKIVEAIETEEPVPETPLKCFTVIVVVELLIFVAINAFNFITVLLEAAFDKITETLLVLIPATEVVSPIIEEPFSMFGAAIRI